MSRFSLPLFLLLMLLPWQSTSGQQWATKMFAETSHDFRVVGRGAKCEHHFVFRNLYEEDVHVAAVRSSCGCTTPTVTEPTVRTHQQSAIVAAFNTTSFTGQKSATITVVFDKPYYAEVQLTVSGYIRTDVVFDPPEVAFGELPEGSSREIPITVTRIGRPDWQIKDVRSECSSLAVRLQQPKRTGDSVQYPMVVALKPTMPVGALRERLTIVTNDADLPTVELAVSGRIRPSLSVSPEAVSLGILGPGGMTEKRLIVRGDEPFRIKDVVCADPRFTFEFAKDAEPKKLHFVTLRYQAGDEPEKVTQQVRVVSDLPGDRAAQCIVTGTVQGPLHGESE